MQQLETLQQFCQIFVAVSIILLSLPLSLSLVFFVCLFNFSAIFLAARAYFAFTFPGWSTPVKNLLLFCCAQFWVHINIIIYAVIYKCNNLSSDFCKYVIDQFAEREMERRRERRTDRQAVFMWPGLQNELENNTKMKWNWR